MENKNKKFVIGILFKAGKYLAEKRGNQEDHFAGKILFPGGLIEKGETSDAALVREIKEEMGISITKHNFIGEFYYEDGCSAKVYLIAEWEGIPRPLEAQSLIWVKDEKELSNDFDKSILRLLKINV